MINKLLILFIFNFVIIIANIAQFPSQNWNKNYSGNVINWNKIIVSGHSQGGIHAAVIAMIKPIKRVLMFASPNDYINTLYITAPWKYASHVVADSNYYGFLYLNDEIANFWKQYEIFDALNLSNFGNTVEVEETTIPFNSSRQLYTKRIASSGTPLQLTHDIMIRDLETPLDLQGNPVFECIWKYMLGIECTSTAIHTGLSTRSVDIFPNPVIDEVNLRIYDDINHTYEVLIYNIYGKQRYQKAEKLDNTREIDFKNYPPGIYILKILENGNIVETKKIIKT